MESLSLQRRAGFTFLEVMIVVMIIGILAAMAVPGLAGAADAAKEARSGRICRPSDRRWSFIMCSMGLIRILWMHWRNRETERKAI